MFVSVPDLIWIKRSVSVERYPHGVLLTVAWSERAANGDTVMMRDWATSGVGGSGLSQFCHNPRYCFATCPKDIVIALERLRGVYFLEGVWNSDILSNTSFDLGNQSSRIRYHQYCSPVVCSLYPKPGDSFAVDLYCAHRDFHIFTYLEKCLVLPRWF